MTASEFSFLALGLILGVVSGAALIEIVRARPPAPTRGPADGRARCDPPAARPRWPTTRSRRRARTGPRRTGRSTLGERDRCLLVGRRSSNDRSVRGRGRDRRRDRRRGPEWLIRAAGSPGRRRMPIRPGPMHPSLAGSWQPALPLTGDPVLVGRRPDGPPRTASRSRRATTRSSRRSGSRPLPRPSSGTATASRGGNGAIDRRARPGRRRQARGSPSTAVALLDRARVVEPAMRPPWRPNAAPTSDGSPTSAASSRPVPAPRPMPRPTPCASPSEPTTRTRRPRSTAASRSRSAGDPRGQGVGPGRVPGRGRSGHRRPMRSRPPPATG